MQQKHNVFFSPHEELSTLYQALLHFNPSPVYIHGAFITRLSHLKSTQPHPESETVNLSHGACGIKGWVVSCPAADSWKRAEVAALCWNAEKVRAETSQTSEAAYIMCRRVLSLCNQLLEQFHLPCLIMCTKLIRSEQLQRRNNRDKAKMSAF